MVILERVVVHGLLIPTVDAVSTPLSIAYIIRQIGVNAHSLKHEYFLPESTGTGSTEISTARDSHIATPFDVERETSAVHLVYHA